MLSEDWLGSYQSIDGIRAALQRVSLRLAARMGRVMQLETAASQLLLNFDALQADFAEFFPLIQSRVE
jgi:acyl carrier protein phosphodiesterase